VQQGQPPPNAAYGAGSYAASTNDMGPPADATPIVSLLEAVTVAELADPKEYDEILEDMRDECSKYGQVCLYRQHSDRARCWRFMSCR
jgi:hypothetical protein